MVANSLTEVELSAASIEEEKPTPTHCLHHDMENGGCDDGTSEVIEQSNWYGFASTRRSNRASPATLNNIIPMVTTVPCRNTDTNCSECGHCNQDTESNSEDLVGEEERNTSSDSRHVAVKCALGMCLHDNASQCKNSDFLCEGDLETAEPLEPAARMQIGTHHLFRHMPTDETDRNSEPIGTRSVCSQRKQSAMISYTAVTRKLGTESEEGVSGSTVHESLDDSDLTHEAQKVCLKIQDTKSDQEVKEPPDMKWRIECERLMQKLFCTMSSGERDLGDCGRELLSRMGAVLQSHDARDGGLPLRQELAGMAAEYTTHSFRSEFAEQELQMAISEAKQELSEVCTLDKWAKSKRDMCEIKIDSPCLNNSNGKVHWKSVHRHASPTLRGVSDKLISLKQFSSGKEVCMANVTKEDDCLPIRMQELVLELRKELVEQQKLHREREDLQCVQLHQLRCALGETTRRLRIAEEVLVRERESAVSVVMNARRECAEREERSATLIKLLQHRLRKRKHCRCVAGHERRQAIVANRALRLRRATGPPTPSTAHRLHAVKQQGDKCTVASSVSSVVDNHFDASVCAKCDNESLKVRLSAAETRNAQLLQSLRSKERVCFALLKDRRSLLHRLQGKLQEAERHQRRMLRSLEEAHRYRATTAATTVLKELKRCEDRVQNGIASVVSELVAFVEGLEAFAAAPNVELDDISHNAKSDKFAGTIRSTSRTKQRCPATSDREALLREACDDITRRVLGIEDGFEALLRQGASLNALRPRVLPTSFVHHVRQRVNEFLQSKFSANAHDAEFITSGAAGPQAALRNLPVKSNNNIPRYCAEYVSLHDRGGAEEYEAMDEILNFAPCHALEQDANSTELHCTNAHSYEEGPLSSVLMESVRRTFF